MSDPTYINTEIAANKNIPAAKDKIDLFIICLLLNYLFQPY